MLNAKKVPSVHRAPRILCAPSSMIMALDVPSARPLKDSSAKWP